MNTLLIKMLVFIKLALKITPFITLNTLALIGFQMLFAGRMPIHEYGNFNLWLAWLILIAVMACYLFNNLASSLKASLQEGKLPKFKWSSFIATGVGLAGFILISSFLMLDHLNHSTSKQLLSCGLWLLPLFMLMNLTQSFLQGERFSLNPVRLYQLLIYFMTAILGLCLLDESKLLDGLTAVIAISVAITITLFIQFWSLRYHTRQTEVHQVCAHNTTKQRRSFTNILSTLGFTALLQAGVMLVYLTLGGNAAAFYAAAASLALLIDIPRAATTTYSAQFIINLYREGDTKSLQKLIDMVAKINFWPTLVLTGVLLLFGSSFLKLFGSQFQLAYPVLCLLAVVQAWYGINHVSIQLMSLVTKPKTSLATYSLFLVLYLGLGFILLKTIGLIGAPIALGITQLGLRVWVSTVVKNKLKLHVYQYLKLS